MMETLIIGKPAINIYLPLQEFPNEGDTFTIKGKNESLGNVGATSACLLSKWGMHAHVTGVVGNDAYAEKIRDTFREYKVNSKYLETQFESGTSVNYIILNNKTGYTTKILYNNPEAQLTKYKYDFSPGAAIMDGTDTAGAYAILNNARNCKTILFARSVDKDLIAISKRCSYVVCTQNFAQALSKVNLTGSKDEYFDMYQKIVDSSGHSNYVIILDNHKILYSIKGEVKLLGEMKINVADYSSFESVFTGAFSFAVLNGLNLNDAVKLANTAAAISLAKVGEVASIPTIDEVLDNTGLRDKLLEAKAQVEKEEAEMQSKAPSNAARLGYGGINTQSIVEAREKEEAAAATPEVTQPSEAETITQTPAPEIPTPSAFNLTPEMPAPAPNPTPAPQAPAPEAPTPTPQPKVETNMFDNPNNG